MHRFQRFAACALVMILLAAGGWVQAQQKCEDDQAPLPDQVRREKEEAVKARVHGAETQKQSVTALIRGEKTDVHYQKYSALIKPSKGVIVSLCGGPGFSCTDGGRPENFPPDYDVVTLDYLGIGANKQIHDPERMSIEAQGEAVAAIAGQFKDQDFLLYGQSFGTTVATVAGSLLTQPPRENKHLKGVVLEGVVGKKGGSAYGDGFYKTAAATWNLLSAKEKSAFKKAYAKATKGMNADQKMAVDGYLTDALPQGPLAMAAMLKNFGKSVAQLQKRMKRAGAEMAQGNDPASVAQYRAAGCEINSQYAPPGKIFGGLVNMTYGVPKGAPTPCDCPTVARDWNPDEHKIRGVPIVYINSKTDPATPYDWARGHFAGQDEASEKVFLSPKLGGHWETMGYGALTNCSDTIFNSVFAGKTSLLQQRTDSLLAGECGGTNAPGSAPGRRGHR